MPEPDISLIIPTLNEAENLPALCERVHAALNGRAYEMLIVDDDSRDNTPQVCAELSNKYPLKLIERKAPKDGLGGAVLCGMRQARGRVFVVMDADLQHPPEKLPELIAPLERDKDTDFVLGSRYVPGGGTYAKWTLSRKINSEVATLLARPFSGPVTDPMSGFFALRRETFAHAQRLTPYGYKIGLELMCKCRVRHVREVPIHFAQRERGQSKLSLREQFRYLEHLSRLYDFCYPRISPIAKFLIVTALGWLVGLGTYAVLLTNHVSPPVAIPFALMLAIALVAMFHQRYIRAQRDFLLTHRPWLEFWLVAYAELIAGTLAGVWAWHRLNHPRRIEVFFIAFLVGTATRYLLRKELMQDIRGLRRELRREEIGS